MKRLLGIMALLMFCVSNATLADNIEVECFSIKQGETKAFAINLNNTVVTYIGFQMDLVLPDGLTINKADCSLTTRFSDGGQTLTVGKQGDGSYRLISSSMNLMPITGKSGAIVNVSVTANDDFNGGVVEVKNVKMVDADGTKTLLDATMASVHLDFTNGMYINDMRGRAGGTITLPVYLKCEEDIYGFQLDVVLPEGVTVATNEDDSYQVSLVGELSRKFSIFTNKQSNNTYTIALFSASVNKISAMDGQVFQMILNLSDSLDVGDYAMSLRNVQLTKKVGNAFDTIFAPDYTSILTVDDIIMGDVNNDGLVNITDVVSMVSHIIGNEVGGFNVTAADVTADGIVNITDVVSVLYGIIGQ
ncbi:MAG: dockerin type I repeat-containing protein [Prevotella sp.]|nr:dockerin type I repeat-containing protein [Prevotella sp.]